MSEKPTNLVSGPIRSALRRLRRKIRRYVWLEGISLGIIWVVATFFVSFAIDALPVKFGLPELSWTIRLLLLLAIGAVLGWLLYTRIATRAFVEMTDKNLALLIERKYPEFGESLVTTVESGDSDVSENLFQVTQKEAERNLSKIDVDNVLNWPRLNFLIAIGLLSAMLIGTFALVAPTVFGTATQRLYLLSNEGWPRANRLEIVGIRVKYNEPVEGIPEMRQIVKLTDRTFKVPKGASVTIMVNAITESKTGEEMQLPSSCEFCFWGKQGNRGRQTMKKIGAPREGRQLYSLDSGPLDGVDSDLKFQIRGGDFRSKQCSITVVDQPVVLQTQLDCQYPDYIVDEESSSYTPRKENWYAGMKIPQGTQVEIVAKTNKPLKKVYAKESDGSVREIPVDGDRFRHPARSLDANVTLQFYLCDTDGIVTEIPHVVSITAVEDQTPQVRTTLLGIGTAITADAVLPIKGSILDDYGIQSSWVEINWAEQLTTKSGVELQNDGEFETAIDFRALRQVPGGFSLASESQQQVSVFVKADDFYSLGSAPNLGLSDQYVLDVVSPSELLRILERLEVAQRRRFEQVYQEMSEAREILVRAKATVESTQPDNEPGDQKQMSAGADAVDDLKRHELRLLFAQRATLQGEKSMGETAGIGNAFKDIRLQLINNRIDSEDRKRRLQDRVIKPLNLITSKLLKEYLNRTQGLEDQLRNLQADPFNRELANEVDQLAVAAIEQNDLVLDKMNQVLSILIKYETQNELLDLVRALIKKQTEIKDRTRRQRENDAFEGLLD